jgi:hypothetical protein
VLIVDPYERHRLDPLEVIMKIRKFVAGALLASAVIAPVAVPHADAARRCPRGQEDVNNICVPAPDNDGANHG